MMAKKTKS
jgi:calcium-dependent protein kinase